MPTFDVVSRLKQGLSNLMALAATMVGGNLAFKTLQSYQLIGRRVSSPYAGVHRLRFCANRTSARVFPVRGGLPLGAGSIAGDGVSSPYAGVHRCRAGTVSAGVSSPYAGVYRPLAVCTVQ